MTTARQSIALLLLAALALVSVWRLSPGAPPLYDGLTRPADPYRYLNPPPHYAHRSLVPYGQTITVKVGPGASQGEYVATAERPPQIILSLDIGAYIIPHGVSALTLSARPVPPPAPAADGPFDGNVYLVSVRAGKRELPQDQAGGHPFVALELAVAELAPETLAIGAHLVAVAVAEAGAQEPAARGLEDRHVHRRIAEDHLRRHRPGHVAGHGALPVDVDAVGLLVLVHAEIAAVREVELAFPAGRVGRWDSDSAPGTAARRWARCRAAGRSAGASPRSSTPCSIPCCRRPSRGARCSGSASRQRCSCSMSGAMSPSPRYSTRRAGAPLTLSLTPVLCDQLERPAHEL